jgi:threonyl-tRNA synthetase
MSAEAARLDHRDLNRDLRVFATDPLAGAGLPLWLPDGAVIREELQALARDLARADGCQGVYSPVLGKRALYERSGHWAKFSDDMFPPMAVGGDELVLRPANCPHHALIYASAQRSWRELPVRLNELGAMFRAERSGVLSGLSRVRQISLDDTHVFCRPDQVADEAARGLRAALRAQEILGLPVDYVRLSLRDDSTAYLGSAPQWQAAEAALREAAAATGLTGRGLSLVDAAGEAAFYGPKLDLQVRDGRGQEETIATVQVDFSQPERFGLVYDAPDGSRQPVIMIHRGTVGAMERVTAALLEHYQGRLPLWLAPVQVRVLPVSPGQDEAARRVTDGLLAAGLRARLDVDGSLGARIRHSRQRRDYLIAVLGEAEAAAGTVRVTDVAAGLECAVGEAQLVRLAGDAYAARRPAVDWPPGITAL